MHCFRDAPPLRAFLRVHHSSELIRLVVAQMEALAAFDDVPLGDLANFLFLEPGDSTGTLELALGRNIADIPIEICVSHFDWFELVIIVSDDGFGYVVFIPKNIADQSLLDFCVSRAARATGDAP